MSKRDLGTTVQQDFTPRKIKNFQAWLADNGAEVIVTSNEHELVRFKSEDKVSIIYKTLTGKVTFTGDSKVAYSAYRHSTYWKACKQKRRTSSDMRFTIRNRDGDKCFFCMEIVSAEDGSIEHLVARCHDGPNHVSNLFLAHKSCNIKAGNLSAVEKIKIHVAAHISKYITKEM